MRRYIKNMIFCHFLVFFVFPSPHYPAYEMQQRESVYAFAVDILAIGATSDEVERILKVKV